MKGHRRLLWIAASAFGLLARTIPSERILLFAALPKQPAAGP